MFVKKGIFDQASAVFKVAEFVSAFGQSASFDPMFREFVSSFGSALPLNVVGLGDAPLSLGDDLLTLE